MSVSTGETGRGAKFGITDGTSPSTWITIGNATSISLQGRNAEEIDFTHLLSEGGFREFRQGFKDAGTVSVNAHFNPSDVGHALMNTLFGTGADIQFRINLVGVGFNYYLLGSGFVQNPGDIEINVDGPITGAMTVRVSGETSIVAS